MNRPHIKLDTIEAIEGERFHQIMKWGNNPHTTGEWILILTKLVDDARIAWITKGGDEAALHEVRQIAATAVACMEENGVKYRDL